MFKTESRSDQMIALILVCIGASLRVLPHPDNFTPVTAIALFSGVVLSPALALTVPLVIMVISDILIGPHPLFFLTWGCFLIVTLIGLAVRRNAKPLHILGGTLGGSALFFVVSNLGVFIFENMYPKSFAGLVECFVMALPFFQNSLAGDLFFSLVFFLAFYLARHFSNKFVESRPS